MAGIGLESIKLETIFTLEVLDKDGNVKKRTPEFKNIVLDQGLDRLGIGSAITYCRVGTGSSIPVADQTDLDAQVTYTTTVEQTTDGLNVAQGYSYITKKYRFAMGTAAGNITEVGLGWNSTGDSLYNRAMIRDTDNNPTTVTVLDDEVLDVYVELRSYMPLTTSRINVVISGANYEIYFKPLIVAKPQAFSSAYNCTQARAYTEDIAATNNYPSANSILSPFGVTNLNYVPGSLNKEFTIYWGLNQGNQVPLRTVVIETPYCTYQAQFDPPIPKTSETVLKLGFRVGWGRYL